MDAPSLVTHEERKAVAEEIAARYLSFARAVIVTFYRDIISVQIMSEKPLNTSTDIHTVVIEKEDF